MNNMKTGQAGLQLIESFEGIELVGYNDQNMPPIPTIGYGHTGPDVYVGETITQEQAEEYLQGDLGTAENAVNNFVTVDLNQNQFDALVDFTYNCGSGNFKSSTLLSLLNQGQYDQVPVQMLRWNKVNGQPNDGLTRRRKAEGNLFTTPVDSSDDSSSDS
jgi:lysozyme